MEHLKIPESKTPKNHETPIPKGDLNYLEQILKALNTLNKKLDSLIESKTFTVQEVAKIVNKTPSTIRKHLAQGLLQGIKNGRDYSITQDQLNDYLTQ